jgi:hypothetical protein
VTAAGDTTTTTPWAEFRRLESTAQKRVGVLLGWSKMDQGCAPRAETACIYFIHVNHELSWLCRMWRWGRIHTLADVNELLRKHEWFGHVDVLATRRTQSSARFRGNTVSV